MTGPQGETGPQGPPGPEKEFGIDSIVTAFSIPADAPNGIYAFQSDTCPDGSVITGGGYTFTIFNNNVVMVTDRPLVPDKWEIGFFKATSDPVSGELHGICGELDSP